MSPALFMVDFYERPPFPLNAFSPFPDERFRDDPEFGQTHDFGINRNLDGLVMLSREKKIRGRRSRLKA
jgi:hypothetical protein